MSLKHLFGGIMVGVFALALGADPLAVAPAAVTPVAAAADKAPSKTNEDKRLERAAKDAEKEKDRDAARTAKADTAGRDLAWSYRLGFPSGNKF